jgi:hypothetical protein
MTRLNSATVELVKREIGKPDYAITLTLKPIHGSRRSTTKRMDAEQAFSWFLHLMNTRCFGRGYRRKSHELGVFAALEGLEQHQQPHWHVAVRLPSLLSHERFLTAFAMARLKTRRFGRAFDIQPFYEGGWIEYCLKTGITSFCPQFLRAGTP